VAILAFPVEGEKEGELEGASMEEVLLNRRGIAEGSSDTGVDKDDSNISPSATGGRVGSFTRPSQRFEARTTRESAMRRFHETLCVCKSP
jgi:hypothetical protein